MITVSIVSHGQAVLVERLLADLAALGRSDLHFVVTLNIPEEPPATSGLDVRWIRNAMRMGFGANHNQALRGSTDEFVCILNPDVRLRGDPFPDLLAALAPASAGLAAPRVVTSSGSVENSARRFPTFLSLAAKALRMNAPLDYPDGDATLSPDWVAGMFMLARRTAFEAVHGFDERYFMYYEDVDLCRRLRRAGLDVRLVQSARIVHDAQRASHRDPRYLKWHLASIARFLLSGSRD